MPLSVSLAAPRDCMASRDEGCTCAHLTARRTSFYLTVRFAFGLQLPIARPLALPSSSVLTLSGGDTEEVADDRGYQADHRGEEVCGVAGQIDRGINQPADHTGRDHEPDEGQRRCSQ